MQSIYLAQVKPYRYFFLIQLASAISKSSIRPAHQFISSILHKYLGRKQCHRSKLQ